MIKHKNISKSSADGRYYYSKQKNKRTYTFSSSNLNEVLAEKERVEAHLKEFGTFPESRRHERKQAGLPKNIMMLGENAEAYVYIKKHKGETVKVRRKSLKLLYRFKTRVEKFIEVNDRIPNKEEQKLLLLDEPKIYAIDVESFDHPTMNALEIRDGEILNYQVSIEEFARREYLKGL